MRRKYDFFARRVSWGYGIDLSMALRLPHGMKYGDEGAPLRQSVATSITFNEVDQDEGLIHDPLLQMSMEDAQSLMNELWEVGVRPANGVGSVGQLAATETHLKDMQKIAFDLLTLVKVQP